MVLISSINFVKDMQIRRVEFNTDQSHSEEEGKHGRSMVKASKIFCKMSIIALSFMFDKYYPIMD